MATVIRKNLRNFIAVVVLVIIAVITSYVIVQQQRLRIPVLEEKPFELKADFQKIGQTMTDEWLKTAGADGKAIVDAYRM